MIKKILLYYFLFFICLLSSCIGYNKRDYFEDMIDKNEFKYLSYTDLKYFYHYTSGFEDQVGLNYYYFSFEHYADEFIAQFKNDKNSFYSTKSDEFETKLVNDIYSHINTKYYEIPSEYRIDFTQKYKYSYFPMIYYTDTNILIIIEFIYKR